MMWHFWIRKIKKWKSLFTGEKQINFILTLPILKDVNIITSSDFLEVFENSESQLKREITQGASNPLWNKVLLWVNYLI